MGLQGIPQGGCTSVPRTPGPDDVRDDSSSHVLPDLHLQ